MSASPLRRVLLVGFMGAGKTSVGETVAARLGWRFVDFDRVVEERAGAPVREIFAQRGEDAFRELERDVGVDLLRRERVVLGAGGGWAATEGRLEGLPEGTASFWLRVSAEEALRRVGREPGRRPLLDVEEPAARAAELLAGREPLYRKARWAVDTDGATVEDVSARILEILVEAYPGTDPE